VDDHSPETVKPVSARRRQTAVRLWVPRCEKLFAFQGKPIGRQHLGMIKMLEPAYRVPAEWRLIVEQSVDATS